MPTVGPLSTEPRAEVREDLLKLWYHSEMDEYRRILKASWIEESNFLSIEGSNARLHSRLFTKLYNKLTSVYWMPSADFDGRPLPMTAFGCFFNEWFKYHNNEPNIEFGNFVAHLMRVYPTGPTTIQETINAQKPLCNEAALLLEGIDRGEANEFLQNRGSSWRRPQNYNLRPTYRAIITILDRYVDAVEERDSVMIIDLEKYSKNQTVLLVRTGDESHLSAPVDFDAQRGNGLCLPRARIDVPAASGDVVRVSLANAVKYIADLQQREDTTSPQPRSSLERERKAKKWADKLLKEADDKGIDNVYYTREAVRRVKAHRMGETFEEWEPYPLNRYYR